MATNIYLPEQDKRLADRGFRWCTKDCRWESRRSLSGDEILDLAEELGPNTEIRIEVSDRGGIVRTL